MTLSDSLAIFIIGSIAALFTWAFVYILAGFLKFIAQIFTKRFVSLNFLNTNITVLSYFLAIALISYNVYFAIYPKDNFYLGEFAVVTKRSAPSETKVLFKDATYPDFHGEYCSYSRLLVTKSSYLKLLNDIQQDQSFDLIRPDAGYISNWSKLESFDFKLHPPKLKVINSFSRNDTESDEHYEIAFLADDRIEVLVCIT